MPFLRVVTALPFQVSIVFYSPRRVPVPLPRPAPLFFPFFIFLLLLFCFVGGAGMARAQEVVDLYLPKTLKLHIPPYTPPNFMDEAVEWTGMNRTVVSGPGTGLSASVTPDSFYYDHSWISGTRYQYHMTGTRHYWAEETYLDANGTPQTRWVRAEQFITSQPINVTPVLIPVSENQSVDSRYDMRYGDPTFLDHKFNTTAYRGGLFAGFANDPSRVGHGYLKFPLTPSTITGEKLWPVGGLSVWFERLARSGSGTVATQGASSDSWSAGTLTWSTAPVLDGTKGPAITLQYDRNHAAGQWVRLNCLKDVETELAGDMGLTLAVIGDNESANTWAYFAKKEFVGGHTASLLYAFGGPGTGTDPITTGGQGTVKVDSVSVDPSYIEGGTALVTDPVTSQQYNLTGTVTLNNPAPQGGTTVTLTSATPATIALLSSTVVIPEGATTAAFKLRANAVTVFTQVEVTAAYGGQAVASVSVAAPGGGI